MSISATIPDLHPIAIPTPFPVGAVNVFLWKGDPLTLIDCGPRTDEAYDALTAGLAAHGVALQDIERVLLTHHHVDHIGMLRRILDASSARSFAHPEVPSENHPQAGSDAEWEAYCRAMLGECGIPGDMHDAVIARWAEFRKLTEPYHIDVPYEDGMALDPFTICFVPGHSVSDTLVINRADGYAIVGDHILEFINPNPLIHRPNRPGEPRMKSLVTYQQSLRRSASLDLGVCFPGHGAPFDDHRRIVQGILSRHDRRERRILGWMKTTEAVTPYILAQHLYPDIPIDQLYLVLSVALGHLEVMEEEGLAHSARENGILHYALTEAAVA